MAAALALIGGVTAAIYSPLLALENVVVRGATLIEESELHDAVAEQLGTPLVLIDSERLREDLEEFTLIRSYTTQFVPPDTLVLTIVERVPIGALEREDGYHIVDAAGVLLEIVAERPGRLPVIATEGGDLDDLGFRGVSEVLVSLPEDVAARVESVTATTRDDVTLELRDASQRVIWGSATDSAAKARQLDVVLALHENDGPGEYDLSAGSSVVFRPGT